MVNEAVSNTGPIIHLTEINFTKAFNIFNSITTTPEVLSELIKNETTLPKKIKIINIKAEWKDKVKVLTNQYNLGLGEASALTLAMQEKTDYFLTDDLEARAIAGKYNIETHGTIGIILRAFRDKIIDKGGAIEKIGEIK